MWFRNLFPNLSDRQISIIQLIFTIGLMVTMLILAIVIIKYGEILRMNPCELCEDCNTILRYN